MHKSKDERVFNLKIGDEVIHRVDIFGEGGYGNVVHKWASFDLREDIVYLNKTYVLIVLSSQQSMHTLIQKDSWKLLLKKLKEFRKSMRLFLSKVKTQIVIYS